VDLASIRASFSEVLPSLAAPALALLQKVGGRQNAGEFTDASRQNPTDIKMEDLTASTSNKGASTTGGAGQPAAASGKPSVYSFSATALSTIALFIGGQASQAGKNQLIERSQSIMNQTRTASNEQLAKLNDSYAQMGSASKAGKWGKFFGWAAAVVGLVVAIGLTIGSGGAAWPLLAASVLGILIMADAATGSHVMNFFTDVLTKVADVAVKVGSGLLSALTLGEVHWGRY
jgi:hypothetical protein